MRRLLAVALWCCLVARVSAEAPRELPSAASVLAAQRVADPSERAARQVAAFELLREYADAPTVRGERTAQPPAQVIDRLGEYAEARAAVLQEGKPARERVAHYLNSPAFRREVLADTGLGPKAATPRARVVLAPAIAHQLKGWFGAKATLERWTRERVIELPPALSWALLVLVPALGVALLVWLIIGFVRELFPFALSRRDPRRLLLGLRSTALLAFTGQVLSMARAFEVERQLSADGRTIRSDDSTSVHLQFFLRDERGKEADIRLRDLDLSLRDGHVMTVVWSAQPRKREESAYLAFYNHTLQRVDFVEGTIASQLRPTRRFVLLLAILPLLWLGLSEVWPDAAASMGSLVPRVHELDYGPLVLAVVCSLLLALVGALLRWLLMRLRLHRFKQQFKRRLVPVLDDDARERADIANAQSA